MNVRDKWNNKKDEAIASSFRNYSGSATPCIVKLLNPQNAGGHRPKLSRRKRWDKSAAREGILLHSSLLRVRFPQWLV